MNRKTNCRVVVVVVFQKTLEYLGYLRLMICPKYLANPRQNCKDDRQNGMDEKR